MSERTEKLGNLVLEIWGEGKLLFGSIARMNDRPLERDWMTIERGLNLIDGFIDEAIGLLASVIEFPALTLFLNGIGSHVATMRSIGHLMCPASLGKPCVDWLKSLDMHQVLRELRDAPERADAIQSEEMVAATREAIGGKKRSSKRETQIKVYAAIAFKMQDPNLPELECARKADIPPTTLHQNPDWQEWSQKAETAAARGSLQSVMREWDERLGAMVAIDPKSVNGDT